MTIIGDLALSILKALLPYILGIGLILVAWWAAKHYMAAKAAADAMMNAVAIVQARRKIDREVHEESDKDLDNDLRPPERRK